MDMSRVTNVRWRLIIGVGVMAVIIGLTLAYLLTRPSQAEFQAAKTTQLAKVNDARKALAPAVNDYLASFKTAYNESKSADQANEKAKRELDAFASAKNDAVAAISTLAESRITFDPQVGPALRQYQTQYLAEVDFYDGLVSSYGDFTELFSQDAERCGAVFVGESEGLADRKSKLDAAAKRCYEALAELKKSSNSSYVQYAGKVERRVKLLQQDAAATVKSEQTLKEFEKRATDYQRQYEEAKARGASDEEILELANELKRFNEQINDNRGTFDFAAKRYINTVKELPELYGNVFATEVPAKQKNLGQLIDMRGSVLTFLIDSNIDPAA